MQVKSPKPALNEIEAQFTDNIRKGKIEHVLDNVSESRMVLYQTLVYNTIKEHISQAFPIIISILTPTMWDKLIRGFMLEHRTDTPYFYKLPKAFVNYLKSLAPGKLPYPCLVELAHYEWIELDVELSDNFDAPVDKTPELLHLDDTLQTNQAVRVLAYRYPVHQISPDFIPEAPDKIPHFIIVYQDKDQNVQFMQANALSAHLIEILQHVHTLKTALEISAENFKIATHSHYFEQGKQQCIALLKKHILIFK